MARSLNSNSTLCFAESTMKCVLINHRETQVNIVSIYCNIHSRDILHSTEVSVFNINRSSTICIYTERYRPWVTILLTQDSASFSQDFSWDFQVFFPPFFSVVVKARFYFYFLSFLSFFPSFVVSSIIFLIL